MTKSIFILGALALALIAVGGEWLYAQQTRLAPTVPTLQAGVVPESSTLPQAEVNNRSTSATVLAATTTPIVGTPIATPSMLVVNTPTPVTVTVEITGPTLIPSSVNLLLLGATGTQPTILGVMQSAGNGMFSLQHVFNAAISGQIQLEVSAAFQGSLKRVLSNIATVDIWNSDSPIGITAINYPNGWYVQQTTSSTTTFSNVEQPSTVTLDSLGFFELTVLPQANPNNLPVDQWFTQFSQLAPAAPISEQSVSIGGHAGILITVPEIGADTKLFVSRGTDIIEMTYNTEAQQYVSDYASMLNSIIF